MKVFAIVSAIVLLICFFQIAQLIKNSSMKESEKGKMFVWFLIVDVIAFSFIGIELFL